ncbi:MAG: YtxH domain-containing protein [Aquaticitalea sp.]
MEKQQKKGLLALLGIGAGVFAWWKYKNMDPEKKEQLHAQVNEAGQKVKDTINDVGQKMKETAHDVETTVKEKYDQLKNNVEKPVDDINT